MSKDDDLNVDRAIRSQRRLGDCLQLVRRIDAVEPLRLALLVHADHPPTKGPPMLADLNVDNGTLLTVLLCLAILIAVIWLVRR